MQGHLRNVVKMFVIINDGHLVCAVKSANVVRPSVTTCGVRNKIFISQIKSTNKMKYNGVLAWSSRWNPPLENHLHVNPLPPPA
ncbi:hypothetical protein OROHE_012771 [Orobanche hederae]